METVERFEIPTPFTTGHVNCYLLDGAGPTLLDPGPDTDAAYDELAASVQAAGYVVEDVSRVLLTHPHPDHFGMAQRIKDESGAQILAHEDATDRLSEPVGYVSREQTFFRSFMVEMGVPEGQVETVVDILQTVNSCQRAVAVDRELADGDTVRAGQSIEVVHTPGHTPGSVCYVARDADAAFTGDHVLAEITPNPVLTVDPSTADGRTRNLPTYLSSLPSLLDYDVTVGYGGHRTPIPDLPARIQEIIAHHETRKEEIAGILADPGPSTAYEVMQAVFGDKPATEMFPAMSEVIGHLDLLEDEGRVGLSESDDVVRYDLVTDR